MSQLLPSEGVNSDEISMGTSNSSEMNLENNDEADHQLRKGLIIVGPAPIASVPFWVPNELDS